MGIVENRGKVTDDGEGRSIKWAWVGWKTNKWIWGVGYGV